MTSTHELFADVCVTGDLVVTGTITGGATGSAFVTPITTTDATEAMDVDSGSLIVDGGAGIAKKLYIGTDLSVGGNATLTGTLNNTVIDTTITNETFSITIGTSTTGAILDDGGAFNNIYIGAGAGEDNVLGDANIAIGTEALKDATNNRNIAIGTRAGELIVTGDRNTCVGHEAGATLTTDASSNVIIGDASTTTTYTNCDNCVFIGATADGIAGTNNDQIAIGFGATTRNANECVIGNASLNRINPGDDNGVDLGASDRQYKDLYLGGTLNSIVIDSKNTGATQSIVIGDSTTGANITSSNGSVAIGNGALASLTTAGNNIAIGANALNASITGNSIAIGNDSLMLQSTTGQLNIGIGSATGDAITTATRNVLIGHIAGSALVTNGSNVCIGYAAGNLLTGLQNVIIGQDGSPSTTSTDECVFIGNDAKGSATDNNQIAIGSSATTRNANECVIGNASLNRINPGDDNGVDLGASDRQFKNLYLGTDAIIGGNISATTINSGTWTVDIGDRVIDTQHQTDSQVWTDNAIQDDNDTWRAVCWSPELGIFCAVSSGGADKVATSPDGSTWTIRTAAGDNDEWYGICWSPEETLFVAVGQTDVGTKDGIMTSVNGTDWVARTGPAGDDQQWQDVCWSPELSLFVGVGDSGDSSHEKIMTSPDGITWTERTSPSITDSWKSVCWSPQLTLFAALGAGTNDLATSRDGILWTAQTVTSNNWRGICWAAEIGLFCAVATSSTRVMTSPDGITWTDRSAIGDDDNWQDVAWSPGLGLFCAVGTSNDRGMTSPDGINWTARTLTASQWYGICWSQDLGIFCAVSATGTRSSISTAVNNNFTLGSQLGEYQRIGKQVFASARIDWIGKGSASGNISINLPFVIGSDRVMCNVGYTANVTFSTQLVFTGTAGDTSVSPTKLISGGSPVVLTDAEFATTGEVQFQINYFTT